MITGHYVRLLNLPVQRLQLVQRNQVPLAADLAHRHVAPVSTCAQAWRARDAGLPWW
jgi:hypothetical protein